MKGLIFTDGGSRGNPGHAGTASLLFDDNMKLIDFLSKSYELLTNNQAEYNAFIDGLNLALKNGYTNLVCFLDSELVVKQINGLYKVKDSKILKLMPIIKDLLNKFESVVIQHIPREKNKLADKLVNLTLDAYENHEKA